MIRNREKRLTQLIAKMDVPSYRTENYSWLVHNLAERNSEHPNFKEAMDLLLEILREQNLLTRKDLKKILTQISL